MATKEFLDTNDTAALEEQAVCLRDQLLIHLLRRTGCRVSEILGIEVNQVDFTNQTVTIIHEKVRVTRYCPYCQSQGNKSRLSKKALFCTVCGERVSKSIDQSKDENEFRSLPLDAKSLDMIKDYIDRGGTKKVGEKFQLFNITRQCAWKVVKDCAERAGLQGIINVKKQRVHHVSPHKLRDAFATNAANKDSSMEALKKLQEHLGHRHINTTMGYVRTSGPQHREWFDNMIEEEGQDED
jgi:integrase/recombinase XerD